MLLGRTAFAGVVALVAAAAPTTAFGAAAPPRPAPPDPWVLSTSSAAAAAAAPAYLGNGYVGTRVPADGAGYVALPVPTETHIAGVYANAKDPITGGVQPQGSVSLPGWTQLDVVVQGRTYSAAAARTYRQQLDLRRGVVTTSATWAVGSRATSLSYTVGLDRGRERLGVVRLSLHPTWTGTLTVRDVLGAGASPSLRRLSSTATGPLSVLDVVTAGTGTRVVEAARLVTPAGSTITAGTQGTTVTRSVTLHVRAGDTYTFDKVVGFATSLDTPQPLQTAMSAARLAPGAAALLTESATAWQRLWSSDIVVPGQPELQRRLHAAMFYLLGSVRPDVDWSISPVGLSAGGYNNHVFWDAETWMYPALLAQHPAEASSVVDYRDRTRSGALRNAARTGYSGMRFAWESALTGDEVTPGWAETGHLEQHVTADVALGQWQYYLATGDRTWLRDRGWPVISGAATFWASRATPGAGGTFHILRVEGPDEQNWPVDDSVYTNATARLTLEIAARAAAVLGHAAPARWAQVAAGLVVLPPAPAGGQPAVRPEFAGYAGQQVKQADAVLLTYPWEYPQPSAVDRSDLDYYTPRYDPEGPAMTDSVNSVVAAQLAAGCSAWTYTVRSLDPFVKAPYEQFTEARSGKGVFTFLTGEGGFLQEFLYGYSGLRWRADRLRLDPMLPPQLSGGLTLTGLRWHGRVLDVAMRPTGTTVTLRSGAALLVETPAGTATLSTARPLALPTRTAGPSADDLLRCQPVTANAADPSAPAVAAVDGSDVTAWTPATDPATTSSLTVTLSRRTTLAHAMLVWQDARPLATYQLQARTASGWVTVASVHQESGMTDAVSFSPVSADAVRLVVPATRLGGKDIRLAEIAATGP